MVIALVFLVLFNRIYRGNRRVYQLVMAVTFVIGVLDGLKGVPVMKETLATMFVWFDSMLPFYSMGLGWVVPAIIAGMIGMVWAENERKNNPEKVVEY